MEKENQIADPILLSASNILCKNCEYLDVGKHNLTVILVRLHEFVIRNSVPNLFDQRSAKLTVIVGNGVIFKVAVSPSSHSAIEFC